MKTLFFYTNCHKLTTNCHKFNKKVLDFLTSS